MTDHLAAELCALAIARLDNAVNGRWRTCTYGARPGDAELVPPPTRTVLLVSDRTGGRWFELALRELDPEVVDVLYDPEILAELRHRATSGSLEKE
jgi:hypothetical protein